jgi:hypothetical protein
LIVVILPKTSLMDVVEEKPEDSTVLLVEVEADRITRQSENLGSRHVLNRRLAIVEKAVCDWPTPNWSR